MDIRPAAWCRCTRGWLGEDAFGRPVPCPSCRPHLGRSHRKQFAAAASGTANPNPAETGDPS